MNRLSLPLERMQPHYDAVVVGSGYGGGIAASRLARAGRKVCLLERGKERWPGEYPDTLAEASGEMQFHLPQGQVGPATGLFDFHAHEDISVLVGCGLGGTSLINANVSLTADPRVFDDPAWPAPLRGNAAALEPYYQRARDMLKPTPYPRTVPKLQAQEKSARHLGQPLHRPPLNVNFTLDGPNHAGVPQKPCNDCGDCVSGCNHWAKNTTLMNYVPDAWGHGAEVFTEVEVKYLERQNGRWVVHFQPVEEGREVFAAPTLFVTADVVVLGAGTLGSTEILLRSKAHGLSLSDRLGERFSGNGDVLGFAYNADDKIHGIGWGDRKPGDLPVVGPCITSVIDERGTPELADGFVIEEGSIPGAIALGAAAGIAAAAATIGRDTDRGLIDELRENGRVVKGALLGPRHGAIQNTQTYLVMSHDGGDGHMSLADDRLRISWPGVGSRPIFERVNAELHRATEALGGTYVRNPTWSKLLGQPLVTVHPLGGCAIGERSETGVTDHRCRVFSESAGTSVYDGLLVVDGAAIPTSVGVNPLFTICAVAERALDLLAAERGWNLDLAFPAQPKALPAPVAERLGIRFTETMRGFFSTSETGDFAAAAKAGEAAGSPMEFTLTIASNDLDRMLKEGTHPARITGSVTAPALAPDPLTVDQGDFQLFVKDPNAVDTRRMVYRMVLTAEGGESFFFDGFKTIQEGLPTEIWPQTTTLYVTVTRGTTPGGALVGKGILTIRPLDFAKQLTTMQASGGANAGERLRGVAQFGQFFAGVLYEQYGSVLAPQSYFDPKAPARWKRPLQVPPAEVHPFLTPDGVALRLTRYRGGSKGPVILVHGAGVSSLIFSTDLIDLNLTEFLVAHGYDVWLLDFRASTLLPACEVQSSGDDVATIDYPAAVTKVRALTGAESVQMVVHCYGANTFFMAMLAGLQGVRSAVTSQIAAHMVTPKATRLKSGLHVPDFLAALGVKSLTAYTDRESNWREKLFDLALRAYPVEDDELCSSPVCHRITFLYSLLYEHSQLDQRIHDHLHELFGLGNITTFEHLARMVRTGHVVDHEGREVYLPHVDRLKIPIRFLHGAENQCYLPKSTELTYDWLRQAHGPELYSRFVIPRYGHIDCIFGKDAARDVYPLIVEHLNAT